MPSARMSSVALVVGLVLGCFYFVSCTAEPDALRLSRTAPTVEVVEDNSQDTASTSSGGPNNGPAGTPSSGKKVAVGLPCNVFSLLQKNCGGCHGETPAFGATTTVVTWAGLDKPEPGGSNRKVRDILLEWLRSTSKPMPPAPATRLLPEEVAILETWTTAGGPRSDDTCSDEPAPPLGQPKQECQPDIRIRPSTPHVIAAEGPMDQYVCYGFDVANTEKKHIVSMAPVVENLKVVHHAQLFETDVPYPSAPTPCDSGESSKWRLVTGWAPGGKAHVFPQEAGWPQAVGTTHYVVQLHYSNPQKLNNEKDNTGFDLCSTTKLRPNDAGMLAFGVMDSFGSILRIPARALKYKMECSYKLPDQFPEIKFISMTPHLHSLGRASSASIQPLGQTNRTSLLDVKDFSFDSQLAYPLTGSAKAGDAIMTSCVWANPRDLTVTWGHNADSEMCYSYLTYYPRMPDIPSTFGFGGFNWLTPAANGECVNVAP